MFTRIGFMEQDKHNAIVKRCKCGRRIQRTSRTCRACNMSGVGFPGAKPIATAPTPLIFDGLRGGLNPEMAAVLEDEK